MSDWQEEYKNKFVSVKEAAGMVKSGDRVFISPVNDPPALSAALAARKNELKNVEITLSGVPASDAGWYDPSLEDVFPLTVFFAGSLARRRLDVRAADFTPFIFSLYSKPWEDKRETAGQWDWFFQVVSPPDKYGYCSYGNMIWHKKSMRVGGSYKKTIAEVDANQIRTFGDNSIHVSEIDYFVENTKPRPAPVFTLEITDLSRTIAGYVSSLVRDGDTIQLGTGTVTDALAVVGAFDDKHDLGIHTEMTSHGMVDLVKRGVVTGKHKTIHPGKVVASCFWPEPGALDYVDMNPVFELYDVDYVNDVRTISSHDNMVAINTAIGIDFTGQIAVESIGPRLWSAPGGQMEFALGALYSKGGRYIVCLASTATVKGKTVSRIMPQLEAGTMLTIPRSLTDYVVTEYGIARLLGKSQRQRANELISIAHPDFRADLKKAAQKLFYQ
ncbi:MAG: acetyl-CoA hydrolase/transferase C-terminal domain-containing protein [Dehalococcoidia bacterium]|nr:acetyl-CoA hydrolase/transferase C-terminal domain-containing protein [Dehalococcoidia bacterium]